MILITRASSPYVIKKKLNSDLNLKVILGFQTLNIEKHSRIACKKQTGYVFLFLKPESNFSWQIFDKQRNYLGLVKTTKPLKRPSGIVLDPNSASLFVLNLWSSSLTKYSLVHK
jgi:hypothetical protein